MRKPPKKFTLDEMEYKLMAIEGGNPYLQLHGYFPWNQLLDPGIQEMEASWIT